MEHLPKGYTLSLAAGSFPLSTDSMVLAHFVHLHKNDRVLDLGSGCGTLGLLLCAAWGSCHVTGIELEQTGHEAALDNIRRNELQGRMESVCADLRTVPTQFAPGSFSVCVSNPPYFSAGPASFRLPLARREDCCTPDDLFRAAAWALKYGGEFFLVHRPERLAELIAKAAAHNLEAKQLRLVRHREDGPISLILLRFRKGGKPGLQIDEISLHDPLGNPTDAWWEIYHKDHS
jgi:tRNA1(Val) A37 N6-methylase TrmN6